MIGPSQYQIHPDFLLGVPGVRYVSASELARFTYCEQQWELERRYGFPTMSDHQLRHLVRCGLRTSDPKVQALGRAAAAYLERVRPALRRGERYHSADARCRPSWPRRIAFFAAILAAAMALVLLSRR